MPRHPTSLDIYAAERRLEAARLETRERIREVRATVRSTVRATLARPSTLAGIAGASALLGFALARTLTRVRGRPATRRSAAGNNVAAQSAGGLIASLVARYAWPRISTMLLAYWTAHRARAAESADAAVEQHPDGFPPNLHHVARQMH